MPESPPSPGNFFDIIQRHPARVFWACVAVHTELWTIIPALTDPNVLTDTIEGYAWGHEWLLGTYKHPPLTSWLLEASAVITGRAEWVHFFVSQLTVAAALWAVWQTGRRITDETDAVIGALLLAGVAYYNILIPEFNPNVLQLPFWALIALSFHRAVKDDRVADWLMLGLWSAAGLYTKYSTALILVALGALMIAHPESRKRLFGRGPWLAALTAIVLLLPHAVWLAQHNFLPFVYAEERLEHLAASNSILALMVWQVAALLPAALIFVVAFGVPRKLAGEKSSSFDKLFLHTVAFGPFVLAALIGVLFGVKIRNMWGAPFWNFIGLWLIVFIRPAFTLPTLRRFIVAWSTVVAVGVGGYAALDVFEPYMAHKAARIYFPGRVLAAQISDAWRQHYHTPLRYVVGDIWVAGNVAWYAPERPHVLVNGDYGISPWVTRDDIQRYGGVIVWCRGDCTHQDTEDIPIWFWQPEFKDNADRQPVMTIPQQTGAKVPPAKIGWAFLPPHDREKSP